MKNRNNPKLTAVIRTIDDCGWEQLHKFSVYEETNLILVRLSTAPDPDINHGFSFRLLDIDGEFALVPHDQGNRNIHLDSVKIFKTKHTKGLKARAGVIEPVFVHC